MTFCRFAAVLVVLSLSLAAQMAPPDLLVVPIDGARERLDSLLPAGLVIGWCDGFLVAPAGAALPVAQARGWPFVAITGAVPGEHLYFVPAADPAEIAALAAVSTVLHSGGGYALVRVAAAAAEPVLALGRSHGHNGAVRLAGDVLHAAPEIDWSAAPRAVGPDTIVPKPEIQAMVAQVVQSNLLATVTALSAYSNRRSDAPGGVSAQNQLVAWFQTIPGLAVTTHSFDANSDNVIAELPGTVQPSKIVIVGGHYDSTAGGATSPSPGADDNASGTASVREVARILAQYQFKYTIRFVCFASEEFGLVGSAAYAQMLVNQGQQVLAMVNTDMNCYRAANDPQDVDFITNNTSPTLTTFARDVCAAYVPALPSTTASLSGGTSDHQSFQQRGIPAVFPFEDIPQYSPFIHTANDTVGVSANDFDLSAKITKMVVALMAELAVPASVQINHTPLGDTADNQGPYRVTATVTSLLGSTITGVNVTGTFGTTPFTTGMVPGLGAGEWIADLPGQPDGTVISYAIEATDALGRQGRYPDTTFTGTPWVVFRIGNRITVYFDDLEGGGAGWTHGAISGTDDWQIGTPTGLAGDPTSAYSGIKEWGNDLGPGGNGAYVNSSHNWLRAPNVNCTGRTGVHLRFRRWLTVEDGLYDTARIHVNGTEVWRNPSTTGGTSHLIDTSWQDIDLDIGAQANNQAAVQVEFRLQTDSSLTFGGWNVDDFSLTAQGPPFFRKLAANRSFTSLAAGNPVTLHLDFGAAAAGHSFLMLPSLSGSVPGIPFGAFVIPLNYDALSEFVLLYVLNTPIFANFQGTLDSTGKATATMALPPGISPVFLGMTVTLAAITTNPVDQTTNAVEVLLIP